MEEVAEMVPMSSPRELSGLHSGWITSFCVVNFDLEYELDYSVPAFPFHSDEISNINEERELDSVFVFRMRREGLPRADHELHEDAFRFDRIQPDLDASFYYGFPYFRQRADPSNPRGYMQRAVVLITAQPFFGLYQRLMEIVGPMFFEFGEALLESTLENINHWPCLMANQQYELPLLGRVLLYRVSTCMFPAPEATLQKSSALHTGVRETLTDQRCVPLSELFPRFLPQLWTLWELVLIGEPLLVLGASPEIASRCVLALISLIRPSTHKGPQLQYSGDFRPYTTIYDSDFGHLSNPFPEDESTGQPIRPSLLLGATNPFFVKSLSHWPHVLKIGFSESASKWRKKKSASTTLKEDFITSHKTRTPVDERVLSSLSSQPDHQEENNERLHVHFLQLTQEFLAPLERYIDEVLLPGSVKLPQRFDRSRFLGLLKSKKLTESGVKKKRIRLYEQFLESRNFTVWYHHKVRHVHS